VLNHKYCLLVFTTVELVLVQYLPEYCHCKQAALGIFSQQSTTTTMNHYNDCNCRYTTVSLHNIQTGQLSTNAVETKYFTYFADRGTTMSDMLSYLFIKSV